MMRGKASVCGMSARDTVTFYLPPQLRKQAERGKHNFIRKVSEVLANGGLQVAFDDDDDLARLRAKARSGRGLFLMQPPANARGLTFRKTYIYPFWRVEKQAERWDWPVAKATFDASQVNQRKAANFYRLWRHRLFGDGPRHARQDGFIYMPLQGQLLRQRSFQTCSPLEMVSQVVAHDTQRHVVVTLHPSEAYSVEEQNALERLLEQNDRILVRIGGTQRLLQNCDYIVTQNSTVGFEGYFYGKPLVMFGRSDFHHVARNVSEMGVGAALEGAKEHSPNYAAYLYWFLQKQAINAGRPESHDAIAQVLRRHGWPV